ncbi:hypothetical protein AB0I69_28385 [Streptomyces sp. NPDC050508]|uniref:hypothetical protein n=1 Tax=Streptomyces sp. NPDC050508 TaxID=3155405 RepID=UPI00341FFEB1
MNDNEIPAVGPVEDKLVDEVVECLLVRADASGAALLGEGGLLTEDSGRAGASADLNALFYVRVNLAQSFPAAPIRDFHSDEYYNAEPDCLIVLGAPDGNTAYAESDPHLSYRFTPPSETAITFPGHGDVRLAPPWAPEGGCWRT